jgi:putative ABC transport system permease protein
MRYALRSLLKSPGFSVIAVAIIAIGIGANTAVFSVVDAALLRPLPFKDAGRLFMLSGTNAKRGIADGPFSYPAYAELASRERLLGGLAAFAYDRFNSTGGDRPEQISGARVSWRFFDVLGLDLTAGRAFAAPDDLPGAPAVAIISRRLWTRDFSTAPHAIGATLTLNGAPYTIVGALGVDLPPPFDGVEVWTTRVDEMSGFTRVQINGGLGYLTAVARLAPGTRVEPIQAELDAIAHGYARANPANTDADPDASLRLVPIRDRTVGNARTPLLILMGAVGLVLLVACANVSNLLLVRATARSHEAAVRAALGAGRWDLVRWLAAESVLLAAAGGVAGVLLAFWGADLTASALRGLPRASEIAVNGRVLLFSCVVSAIAALVFGVVPASLVTRQSPADALRSGGRGATASHRRPRQLLVVLEVALSLVLLVGAGLLLQSFTRLTHVAVGFSQGGLLTLRVSLPTSTYPDPAAMRAFIARAMEKLDATPGVASAAASMALPPTVTTMAPYQIGNLPPVGIGERPVGQWSAVTPGYFATLGIPLIAGRAITERDTEQTPLVVVISRELARRAWPNESAIGKTLLVGRFPGFAEVVGVVGDVKNNGLVREPVVAMYTPYRQRPWPAMQFAVRAANGDPLGLVASVAAAFREVDRDLPMTRVETMDAALSDSIATERLITALLGAFALVALVMATAGLYGVIAYIVAQRTQEIGVRRALGAGQAAILALVLGQGMKLVVGGLAIGLAGFLALRGVLRGLLFDVSSVDPVALASVLTLLLVVALAACYVPARRATVVDPAAALRSE